MRTIQYGEIKKYASQCGLNPNIRPYGFNCQHYRDYVVYEDSVKQYDGQTSVDITECPEFALYWSYRQRLADMTDTWPHKPVLEWEQINAR